MNKKFYFFLLIVLSIGIAPVCGQNYSMSSTALSICSGTWMDPGGSGNYSNDQNITQTICSSSGQTLRMVFTTFSLSAGDNLYVYDGNSVSSTLLGTYTGTRVPPAIVSSGTCLTFRFVSNASGVSSGWAATVNCSTCVPASTSTGSPCSFNGANPFCTDENPYGVTYSSGTSGTAQSFFGTNSVGCLGSVPRPAWYYMRINNPGNLLIYIQQQDLQGNGIDVDFACWGPFAAPTETAFLDKLCCGFYQLNTAYTSSHRPTNGNHNNDMGGYPSGNLVDCSYFADPTEWCYIPNALTGEYYILLITNFDGSAGTITFSPVTSSSTATTDCSLLAQVTNNGPICEGDTLRLYCQNPESGATYAWTGPNGWTSSDQNPIRPNATVNMSGTYTLIKHLGTQTSDPASTTAAVHANPIITLTSTLDTVCSNQVATITAGGGAFYNWSNGMSTNAIAVTPQVSQFYTVTVTSDSSCSRTDSIFLVAAHSDTIHLEDHICVGEHYIAHGFTLNTQTVAGDTLLQQTYVSVHGCDSVVQLVLHRTATPQIQVQEINPEHCEQQDGFIIVAVTDGIGPLTYHWSPSVTGTDSLQHLSANTYYLQVIDSLGCEATQSIVLTGSTKPHACMSLSPSQNTISLGTPIQFVNCSQNYSNCMWDMGNSYSTADANLVYTYPEVGEYTVMLSVADNNGCTDTTSKTIVIHEVLRMYVPNSFSPNGDGVNDVFKPDGIEISNEGYSFTVYNRWGSIIFCTSDLTQGWDGTIKGSMAPAGTSYTYLIRYQNKEGRQFVKKGNVILL